MKVRFIAPARQEFLKEVRFYNAQDTALGEAFAGEIEAAAMRALAFPEAGFRAVANTRRVLVRKFPFSLVYRHDEAGILILAVAHNSRLPGYWAPRVSV